MAFPFLSRLLGRTAPPLHVRRFDGAAGGRRGWGAGTFGRIGTETAAAGPTLRARARYLAANNPWISQAVANWVGALIGAGIEPPADPEAVAVYNNWCDVADADGRTDFRGLQADVARTLVVDGEAFVQIIDSPDGPRLRLIPAELVDESLTVDRGNGRFIVSGIEFDGQGRRAAYWILPARPTDVFATSAQPVRVPADEVLHVMKPLGPGQVRGVSWLAPEILPAGEFDQLCDALLMGAKVAAMHAGFVVDVNGVGTASDLCDGESQPSIEPGTMVRLPGNTDVKFNSPGQISEIGAFLRLNLQQLAAGLGLPEHLLSGDLTNANFSSLRAGLLPFRQRVEQIQYHTLVPQLLHPIWREVIRWAAATGELSTFEDDPRRFLAVEWLPPAFMQVDPLKAVQADIAEMEAGLTSRRKLVAARGWSLADLDAELAAEGWQKPKGASDE